LNLSVQIAPKHPKGLNLANPVMTASGTFGYGVEEDNLLDIQRLGAIVCKGTTLRPREGNLQPRLAEMPSGLLNSIGLQNIGVEALIKEKAPVWAGWQVPVIVNIAGESIGDYGELASRLDNVPGVSGLEVNISCPNVAAGGAEFGANPDTAAEVTAMVRKATSLPVLVKLTPNTGDIVKVAVRVAEAWRFIWYTPLPQQWMSPSLGWAGSPLPAMPWSSSWPGPPLLRWALPVSSTHPPHLISSRE
jgi:dihydroorotate dehydrogenase (NAD+) catalytic subunit